MRESIVSPPTLSARMTKDPTPLTVANLYELNGDLLVLTAGL
jgi:hypothetical protein